MCVVGVAPKPTQANPQKGAEVLGKARGQNKDTATWALQHKRRVLKETEKVKFSFLEPEWGTTGR